MKAFLFKYKIFISLFIIIGISFAVYFIMEDDNTTNNAFVRANVRPISAEISGNIKQIYVKNGQKVQKGQKLFSLDPEPYQHSLDKAQAQLGAARAELQDLKSKKLYLKYKLEVKQNQYNLARVRYNDAEDLIQSGSISRLKSQKFKFRYYEAQAELRAAKQKLKHVQNEIKRQKKHIKALKAKKAQARYELEQTTIRANSQGFIANMFAASGTSIKAKEPVFSLIDTSQWYVQANFEETDLANIKAGDKAAIRLRMYEGDKVYYGEVVANKWAVNRQKTNAHNFLQKVKKENQWVLKAQRFPVLIRINHYDPEYPLHVGASAYVTIEK